MGRVRVKIDQISDSGSKERYKCELCHELLDDPVQTARGYSSCLKCYTESKREDGKCPIDHEPIEGDFSRSYFSDKAKNKEIRKLHCLCVNKEKGCSWEGTVENFEEHELICQYKDQLCQFCNIVVAKDDGNKHFSSCQGINKAGDCIYKKQGCTFKAESEKEMSQHISEASTYHLYLQSNYVTNLEENNRVLKEHVENSSVREQRCQKDISEMAQTIQSLKVTVKNLVEEVKVVRLEQQEAIESHAAAVNTTQQNNPTLPKGATIEATTTLQSNSTGKNKSANKKGAAAATNSNDQLTKQTKEIANIVKKNVASITELDLRFQLHENTTTDGRLLWKIDQFPFRRNQAITGKVTALHSAPCFAGRYGYKFCARLYMDGDGMGRSTHLSLFIVIMKSEYDNLLEWPFQRQVQFSLINQKNESLNVVEKLMPNKDSSSFQKPVKDMNIASGCPLFVEIDRLEKEGFVVDDCMFLEIKVESGSSNNKQVLVPK